MSDAPPTLAGPLDPVSLVAWLGALQSPGAILGGGPAQWRVREIGDGNLNLVFIVEGPDGSVCVKQALPYVRVAGPSWPMSPQRAFFEHSYYAAVAPHVGEAIPRIHHYDPDLHCILMERLAPHVILRQGLIEGRRYERLGCDLGAFVARACFFTSDLSQPLERKLDLMSRFAANTPLVRITAELVFRDPYCENPRNRHTSPALDGIAAELRRDGPLRVAAARLGERFLTATQALIHGDLHTGSVMVTATDSRVIDPEFAFYGPIGFDLGALFGNLLLGWYSQPGHATRADDRIAYQDWILGQAGKFWETFRETFLALWAAHATGDAYPLAMFSGPGDGGVLQAARAAFVDSLFADMLGFAACKMIRRIVGFAHVADFERIDDSGLRARCEAGALAMARRLLTRPLEFPSIGAVLGAVPRMARLQAG
jgi:5-methylthioribose kinase